MNNNKPETVGIKDFYNNIVKQKSDKFIFSHFFNINIILNDGNLINLGTFQTDDDLRLLIGDMETGTQEVTQDVDTIITQFGVSNFTGTGNIINSSYSNASLSFLNLKHGPHENYILNWMKSNTSWLWFSKECPIVKGTIHVDFLDSDETVYLSYVFYEVFPTRIDNVKPDHKSVTNNLFRNVTFKFDKMKVELHQKSK